MSYAFLPVLGSFIYPPTHPPTYLEVHVPRPIRQDSGPGDGETIVLHPQLLHQLDVFLEEVVVVARHVPVLPAFHLALLYE